MKGPRVWFSITGADPPFRGSGSQARWGQGDSGHLFCSGVAGGCCREGREAETNATAPGIPAPDGPDIYTAWLEPDPLEAG